LVALGEYIAYVYNDHGTLKVGVTRSYGTTVNDLWSITPDNTADWPRWTTDQRLLVTSGSNTVYVVWMSGPPAEISRPIPATYSRCLPRRRASVLSLESRQNLDRQ